MLVKKDSILYNLPIGLSLRDLLTLDSIRFTFELIDFNYTLLFKEIKSISYSYRKGNKPNQKNIIPIFNYSWSIIDNCQRLIKQYKLLQSDNNHELIRELDYITPLRNTFQHLDERIEECMIEYEVPFYGVINWEIDLENEEMKNKFYLISGLFVRKEKFKLKTEETNNPLNEISNIKLETLIREGKKTNIKYKNAEINISVLYNQIKSIIERFEGKLNNQFISRNLESADWIKRRDVLLKIEY